MPCPRLKVLPLGPGPSNLRRSRARRGGCRGTGQADDRRRDLLQPAERTDCGRGARRALATIGSTPPRLRSYETQWRARLGPELRAGLAFRTLAARFDDRAVDALLELAAVDGIVPLLRRTANFNWHRETALALLRNPGFRRIVLNSLWS